jgi:hypothetical protein
MDLHNVMRFGDIGRCALGDGGWRVAACIHIVAGETIHGFFCVLW